VARVRIEASELFLAKSGAGFAEVKTPESIASVLLKIQATSTPTPSSELRRSKVPSEVILVKAAFFRMMALACLLSFGLIPDVLGITFTYSDITFPGSISTSPSGINNKGDVVGSYQNSSGVFGFLLSNGTYTTISCPAATTGTYAVGINENGVIVGYYTTAFKDYGFVYLNGECKNLAAFNGSVPYASGINNAGHIVGYYYVATDVTHGFELVGKTYTDLSAPGATQTTAIGINLAGDISGSYFDTSGGEHGFLLRNGKYQTVDIPGAVGKTAGTGLNDKDFVVGNYEDPKLQSYEGFITNSGKFAELIVTGSVTTFASAVNDGNVIVGRYFNGGVNAQGFMAAPSN
jgi:uncharacterized membrane protein